MKGEIRELKTKKRGGGVFLLKKNRSCDMGIGPGGQKKKGVRARCGKTQFAKYSGRGEDFG